MNRTIKWILIGGGGLLLLLIAAIVLIPLLVDVNRYKPQIESRVEAATGRNLDIGGDIELSLFPWVGVALSDLRLGSPAGFAEPQLLAVGNFEARVKLMPLLSGQVEIERVVLEGSEIVLVRNKNGKTNWDFTRPEAAKASSPPPAETPSTAGGPGFSLKSLKAEEIAVRDGTLTYIDHAAGSRNEVSDINLVLSDVSLDGPVTLSFTTRVDGQPLGIEGTFGPIGNPPASQPVSYDLKLTALDAVEALLKGTARNLAEKPAFEMRLEVAPFSPRKVFERLGRPFPVKTADPAVLDQVALSSRISGDATQVRLEDGALDLDGTKTRFTLAAKDFEQPDIAFDVRMDAIDVDRYLPPPAATAGEGPPVAEGGKTPGPPEPPKAPDYGPLRRLVLDGSLAVDRMKVAKAQLQNVRLEIDGRNGRFRIDPLSAELYGGSTHMAANVDVNQAQPRSELNLTIDGVAAGPLVKDVARKDVIEGRLQSTVQLRFQGGDPERIKRSLSGGGELAFADGALVGVDLAAMVRNVQAALGKGERVTEKPKTDFTELKVPFTLDKGTFLTEATRLQSPLLRVVARGKADLVAETLDFRIEPNFVASIKGQGDTEDRKGVMVPILVGGSFQDPSFAPDLKAIARDQVQKEIIDSGRLDEVFEKNEDLKPLEETAKGLLKGIFN